MPNMTRWAPIVPSPSSRKKRQGAQLLTGQKEKCSIAAERLPYSNLLDSIPSTTRMAAAGNSSSSRCGTRSVRTVYSSAYLSQFSKTAVRMDSISLVTFSNENGAAKSTDALVGSDTEKNPQV